MRAVDLFCGAGGSSTGMVATGVEVATAANHWKLAIDTHNTNHPNTDHEHADIREVHPSRFPKTEILWVSPECTNHSLAKGRKRKNIMQRSLWGDDNAFDPEEERSRATMREVVDHAEYHRNEIVIVENVVDIRHWAYYEDWLQAMHNLDYLHKTLYLNAMFFGVPQSRDRWYTVFWRRGNTPPDLDFRPAGWCEGCGREVNCIQAWKKADKPWGRYGERRQYVYRCPQCHQVVHPWTTPAYVAIDFTLTADRICDRDRPLRPKTMDRIRAGVRKFGRRASTLDALYTRANHVGKVRSVTDPLMTQTARRSHAVCSPLVTSVNYFDDRSIPVAQPLGTLTTAQKFAVVNPFIAALRGDAYHQYALSDPLTVVVAAGSQHALIQPHVEQVRAVGLVDPLWTVMGGCGHQGLVSAPHVVTLRQSVQHRGLEQALSTISAGGNNHALVMSYYGNNPTYARMRDPLPTMRTVGHLSLMDMVRQPIGDPLTDDEVEAIVQQSTFRMLQPHELKRGMSFPDAYIVLGTKRDQVRQIGNAVACRVAEWITRQCVESLAV